MIFSIRIDLVVCKHRDAREPNLEVTLDFFNLHVTLAFCKLTELRAKARDAHQAVRTEKAEAQRALQTSRHTLAIEAPP